ncbi:MAG: preprotein translocase subunit SecE [Lachnospiraceae bacterium]|nr:preprotein translocase subunit SecE [Lachnospiraceae bacterium]
MGNTENKTEKTQKKSFFKGVKSEFKKIIWPTKENLTKETIQVVVVSVILGVLIAIIDVGVKFGFDKLLQLG